MPTNDCKLELAIWDEVGERNTYSVVHGAAAPHFSLKDITNRSSAEYQLALEHAAIRWPDVGLDIVFDRKRRASYVKATKAFSSLTMVAWNTSIRTRTIKSGENIDWVDTIMAEAPCGTQVVCAPVPRVLNVTTVDSTTHPIKHG